MLFLAIWFGANSLNAIAAETTGSANASVAETISHLEKAIVEIKKSDFNYAQSHIKAARTASSQITGVNETILKQANDTVLQGQKQVKLGEVNKAVEDLTKAMAEYKSL
jgi:hypothetical protein